MSRLPAPVLRHLAAIRVMLVFTVVLGLAYPLVMTGIAQAAFRHQADGSLITNSKGQVVGSTLLCQTYVAPSAADAALNKKDGVTGYADPLDKYFQPRPTFALDAAAGGYTIQLAAGCDYAASGGNNLGPSSTTLAALVSAMRTNMARFDSVSGHVVTPAQVATDAVTESGSDEEPYISPQNAEQQAPRIARARGIPLSTLETLIAANTTGRDLGFLGEPGVNTTTLNLALDQRYPTGGAATTPFETAATTPAAAGGKIVP